VQGPSRQSKLKAACWLQIITMTACTAFARDNNNKRFDYHYLLL